MPNGTTVYASTAKDIPAWNLLVDYNGGSIPAARYATSVMITSGEQESYAWVGYPVNSFPDDEAAPNMALRLGGIPDRLLLKTRCQVSFNQDDITIPILSGTLRNYVHDFTEDSASAMIVGDAWLLQKITMIGRITWDPVSNKTWYDTNSPLVFNEGGWPSCLDSDLGPVFSPSWRYGFNSSFDTEDFDEPLAGDAKTRARSWNCGDILNYLRMATSGSAIAIPPVLGNQTISFWVDWPSTANDVLGASTTRIVRDFRLQGDSLIRCISKTLRKAGAYDIFFEANGFNSTIKFINQNPGTSGLGTALYLPGAFTGTDIGSLMSNGNVIRKGVVEERITDYFHNTAIVGDGPCVERICSTAKSEGTLGAGFLEFGWDRAGSSGTNPPPGQQADPTSDEGKFNKFVSDNGNSQLAFEQACKIYPYVYCAYKVHGDPFVGTKWESLGMNGIYPRIRPFLLTGTSQANSAAGSGSQTSGGSSNPRDWIPRDILVQFAYTNQGTEVPDAAWYGASRYDSLQISPDGQMVLFPALRDSGVTWSSSRGQYEGAYFFPQMLRLTLAAQGDQAMGAQDQTDYNNTAPRIMDDGDYQWTYLATGEGPDDYVDFVRIQSYPEGTDLNQLQWPDRCTAGNELFSDIGASTVDTPDYTKRLPRHAQIRQKDVRRIANPGQLVMATYSPGIVPGMAVNIIGGISTYSVVKSIQADVNTQDCIVELGSPDCDRIYDIPSVGHGYHPSSAGSQPSHPKNGPGAGSNSGAGGNDNSTDSGSYNTKPTPASPGAIPGTAPNVQGPPQTPPPSEKPSVTVPPNDPVPARTRNQYVVPGHGYQTPNSMPNRPEFAPPKAPPTVSYPRNGPPPDFEPEGVPEAQRRKDWAEKQG
jgi:hypothetical protein